MKNKFGLMYLSTLIAILLSCKKEAATPVVKLTACPDNTTCSYVYIDNADIGAYKIIPGSSRVFQAKFQNSYSTTSFNFKTCLKNSNFYISDRNIKSGAVTYLFSCPSCNYLE